MVVDDNGMGPARSDQEVDDGLRLAHSRRVRGEVQPDLVLRGCGAGGIVAVVGSCLVLLARRQVHVRPEFAIRRQPAHVQRDMRSTVSRRVALNEAGHRSQRKAVIGRNRHWLRRAAGAEEKGRAGLSSVVRSRARASQSGLQGPGKRSRVRDGPRGSAACRVGVASASTLRMRGSRWKWVMLLELGPLRPDDVDALLARWTWRSMRAASTWRARESALGARNRARRVRVDLRWDYAVRGSDRRAGARGGAIPAPRRYGVERRLDPIRRLSRGLRAASVRLPARGATSHLGRDSVLHGVRANELAIDLGERAADDLAAVGRS